MGRSRRAAAGGIIYHVLNRANARGRIFEEDGDYAAFERILGEAYARMPARILAYCLMPNHWHLVLQPTHDGQLPAFMAWVTLTHTQRFHVYRQSVGTGHLYQGRYKSFPVQEDGHFLMVCRYVERNALRAGLVRRAEDWRWSSLWQRTHVDNSMRAPLSTWPVEQPQDWASWVNQAQTPIELASLRDSAQHGKPYGSTAWARTTTARVSDTGSHMVRTGT